MKRINFKSDLKIIESYPGVENFIYHFATDGETCYDVSLEIGNCLKETDEEGKELLIICLDSHGLHEGQLKVRRELLYKDEDFPDKIFNKVVETRYDIFLVDGESDEVDPVEVEGYIPIFRGYSAYDVAVQQGFVGTEAEWLQSLKEPAEEAAREAQTVVTDLINRGNAVITDTTAALRAVLDATNEAKQAAIDADDAANDAWNATSSANAAATNANNAATEARQIGQTKQDKLISGTNIKTINGEPILGSGDLEIKTGEGKVKDVKVNNASVLDEEGTANIDLSGYASTASVASATEIAQNASGVAAAALGGLNSKANTSLNNLTDAGKTVIKNNSAVFVAKYNVTRFADVYAAINRGQKILVEGVTGSYYNNLEVISSSTSSILFFGFDTTSNAGRCVYTAIELNPSGWLTRVSRALEETTNKKSTITNSATYYPTNKAVIDYVAPIKEKVDNLELFKFPNATIFGLPTILQGQISNFTADNYLQFPFIVDFQNRPWQIDMAVIMGADVSGQHNILDSNFGLAFAIQNTKLVLALSYDGVAWAGAYTSSTSIEPNKTYYIKISWDGAIYKVDVSENKTTYTNFITVNSTNTLYPRTITIGKSLDNRYIWDGSINFNEAKLTISDKVVWTGMDDAGLSTRLAVNLNNIDAEGKKEVKSISGNYIITEDMFDIAFDDTKGVAPYSTSYGYTNVTIHEDAGILWIEGANYTFVLDTKVSSSTYRNVRVRIGETGDWKPVMLGAGTIASGSSVFVKGICALFMYKSTYQTDGALHALYDTNTTYTINYTIDAGRIKAGYGGAYAVSRYSLLLQKPDGTWEKVTDPTKTYSTGTTKTVNPAGFNLGQIRYYSYTTNYTNGALIGANYIYNKSASLSASYSFNCGATPNWAVGDYIYLVGTIGADGLFYLDPVQWWSNSLPTSNDGKIYIRLGIALTTTDSTMSLLDDRPIYYHDGTRIREYFGSNDWYGSQAEFDALTEYNELVTYYIYDDPDSAVATASLLSDTPVYSQEGFVGTGIAAFETFDYPLDEEEKQDD